MAKLGQYNWGVLFGVLAMQTVYEPSTTAKIVSFIGAVAVAVLAFEEKRRGAA